ncbi:MAG: type I restriction enzyme HsdR N-terminal domain-containing protein [Haloarculaceae archaeon]
MSSASPSTPESLSEFPDYARRVIDTNPQMNESNTKHKLVDPLLRLLGWDTVFDIELEYSVQMGSTTKHVDYALQLDETPEVFAEIKGCDTSISEGHRSQLASYLKQQNVNWGLLTNGEEFEIITRDLRDGDVAIESPARFPLSEFANREQVIFALSKEAVRSGESTRIIDTMRERRRAGRALQNSKEKLAEEITRIVSEVAGDSVSQRAENHAKAFVDSLAADLEENDAEFKTEPTTANRTPDPVSWESIERATGVRREGGEVVLPEGVSASEAYVSFVEYLFDIGILMASDLPLKLSGHKRYLLDTEPQHPEGESMFNEKSIRDGVFLETHASVSQIRRNLKKLSQRCGIWKE